MHTYICMCLSRVLSRLWEGGDANAGRGLRPTGNFTGGGGMVRSTLEEIWGTALYLVIHISWPRTQCLDISRAWTTFSLCTLLSR